jgi:hypothetical protein
MLSSSRQLILNPGTVDACYPDKTQSLFILWALVAEAGIEGGVGTDANSHGCG